MDKAERLALMVSVEVEIQRYRNIEACDPELMERVRATARTGRVYHDLLGDGADPQVDNPELAAKLSEMFGAPNVQDREAVRRILNFIRELAEAAKV